MVDDRVVPSTAARPPGPRWLEVHVSRGAEGTLRVRLSGALDEGSDPAALLGAIGGDVVLDLRGISRVNSIGIHRWIPAIARLSRAHRVAVEAVPYCLVLPANAVTGLFGRATIRSCLAPYACARCGTDRIVEVTAPELGPAGPPVRPCPECSGRLQFDELDQYFDFMAAPGA